MPKINTKKFKPLITPDWTKMEDFDAFYQKASGSFENRYSIPVTLSQYTSTGGDDPQTGLLMRKQQAIPIGVEKILNFYSKQDRKSPQPSVASAAEAEDWYISIRPKSPLKILVSIKCDIVDNLTDQQPPAPATALARHEIQLNTYTLGKKIKFVQKLLQKYHKEIHDFHGKVLGADLSREASKLSNVIPALSKLMLDNGHVYVDERSDLILLGIDHDYKVLYAHLNQGTKFQNLYLRFDRFLRESSIKNDRTINFLKNLDELYQIYNKQEKIPWDEFFKKFVVRPPKYDFNLPPPRSQTESLVIRKAKKLTPGPLTKEELDKETSKYETAKLELQENLDSIAEFVGDDILSNLSALTDHITKLEAVFTDLFNIIPLKNLIKSALECLGFRGFEFLDQSKQFMNQFNSLFEESSKLLFDLPVMDFPNDFPVVDYMADIGKMIAKTTLEMLNSTVIGMAIALIESILDACNECVIANEAAGRGRFDGLNFGALDLTDSGPIARSLKGAIVQGTLGTLGQGLNQRLGIEQLSAEVLEQSSAWAKHNVGINAWSKAKATSGGDADVNKIKEQQVMSAKAEITKFLQASSTILTPGETGNLLLGCGVGKEPIKAIKKLLKAFPTIEFALKGEKTEVEGEDIESFWKSIGNLIGADPVIRAVSDATERLPESLKCLCDEDEAWLQSQLLKEKGDDITPEQVEHQVKQSIARRNTRFHDLNKILNEDQPFRGSFPVYCTLKKDGTVEPGLIERHHPNFMFMMDQTLNVLYDSVEMAYNRDIEGYLPSLQYSTIQENTISRTIWTKDESGDAVRMINPKFAELVNQGRYSYGSLPHGSTVPGSAPQPTDPSGEPPPGEKIKWNPTMQAITFNLGTWNNPQGAGMWEEGQTGPTGEQEHEWYVANFLVSKISDHPYKDISFRGNKNFREEPGRYTQKFGYSPRLIKEKVQGPNKFVPGLKETFRDFCRSDNPEPFFNIFDQNFSHLYLFNIPNNIMDQAGINLDSLTGFETQLSSLEIPGVGVNAGLIAGATQQAFGILNQAKYEIQYGVPFTSDSQNPKDNFTLDILLSPGSLGSQPVIRGLVGDKELDPGAIQVIQHRPGLQSVSNDHTNHSAPEKYFAEWMKQIWSGGGEIWLKDSNGFHPSLKPDYATGLKATASDALRLQPLFDSILKNVYYGNDSYDGVFKDLFCSFTNQIAAEAQAGDPGQPFFDLENVSALDFSPYKKIGEEDCNPSLLNLEVIKERVKEEFGLIQCIETAFSNKDGLGSNRESPFEKANFGGAVLLTVRTYVIEHLLRSIFVFYYFRYKAADDVDEALVLYLLNKIKEDVGARNFLPEFRREAIELYNRNKPTNKPDGTFDEALNFFVRWQIWSVSNQLSTIVGSQGDTSLDSILLESWIPEYDVPRSDPTNPNSSGLVYDSEKGEWVVRFLKPPQSSDQNSNREKITQQELMSLFATPPITNWKTSGAPTIGQLSLDKIQERKGSGVRSTDIVENDWRGRHLYLWPLGAQFREYFAPPSNITMGGGHGRRDGSYKNFINDIWTLEPPVVTADGSVTEMSPNISRLRMMEGSLQDELSLSKNPQPARLNESRELHILNPFTPNTVTQGSAQHDAGEQTTPMFYPDTARWQLDVPGMFEEEAIERVGTTGQQHDEQVPGGGVDPFTGDSVSAMGDGEGGEGGEAGGGSGGGYSPPMEQTITVIDRQPGVSTAGGYNIGIPGFLRNGLAPTLTIQETEVIERRGVSSNSSLSELSLGAYNAWQDQAGSVYKFGVSRNEMLGMEFAKRFIASAIRPWIAPEYVFMPRYHFPAYYADIPRWEKPHVGTIFNNGGSVEINSENGQVTIKNLPATWVPENSLNAPYRPSGVNSPQAGDISNNTKWIYPGYFLKEFSVVNREKVTAPPILIRGWDDIYKQIHKTQQDRLLEVRRAIHNQSRDVYHDEGENVAHDYERPGTPNTLVFVNGPAYKRPSNVPWVQLVDDPIKNGFAYLSFDRWDGGPGEDGLELVGSDRVAAISPRPGIQATLGVPPPSFEEAENYVPNLHATRGTVTRTSSGEVTGADPGQFGDIGAIWVVKDYTKNVNGTNINFGNWMYINEAHGNAKDTFLSIRDDRGLSPWYYIHRDKTYLYGLQFLLDYESHGARIQAWTVPINEWFYVGDFEEQSQQMDNITIDVAALSPVGPAWSNFGIALTSGGRGFGYRSLHNHAVALLTADKIPYINLLDFDPMSIGYILRWEKSRIDKVISELGRQRRTAGALPDGTLDDSSVTTDTGGIGWPSETLKNMFESAVANEDTVTAQLEELRNLSNTYVRWIDDWENKVKVPLTQAEDGRMAMREAILQKAEEQPVSRRAMMEPLTFDLSNGNLIQEVYLRIGELTPNNYSSTGYASANRLWVSRSSDEDLEGVVNIDAFQNFMQEKFSGGPHSYRLAKKIREIAGTAPGQDDCGEDLTENQPQIIFEDPHDDPELRDFFDSIHVGVRISYVLPVGEFEPIVGHPDSQGTSYESQDTAQVYTAEEDEAATARGSIPATRVMLGQIKEISDLSIASKEKAYFVTEKSETALEGSTGLRDIHIVPIVSVEKPLDMTTKISTCLTPATKTITKIVNGAAQSVEISTPWFRSEYQKFAQNESHQAILRTPEYKMLFKYLFPIDRMLSLVNIYSSQYLANIKDIHLLFDSTKEAIAQLFYTMDNSGNIRASECGTSNIDFQMSLSLGLPISGLAGQMATMIAKAAVLTFKGFMETSDINIILTRRILDLIHVVNKSIAEGAKLANQAQEVGASVVQTGKDIASLAEPCQNNLPGQPPDAWFDPINENFIPEPDFWMVSLALMPMTMLPMFWLGPPLHPIFGPIYWGLDLKPSPNWLNSMPPSDWLDNLFGKEKNKAFQQTINQPPTSCRPDVGLPPLGQNPNSYFRQQLLNNGQDGSGQDGNGQDGNGQGGGSTS